MTVAREIIDAAKKAIAEADALLCKIHEDYARKPDLREMKNSPEQAPTPPVDLLTEGHPSALQMIERIVEFENAGRTVVAALGIAVLRERYEGLNLSNLPADIDTWAKFTAKHVPLPSTRIAELIGKMVHRSGALQCTSCGEQTRCPCGCGTPYVSEHRWATTGKSDDGQPIVSALDRAKIAIAAGPEKSDRVIATEIGVSNQTVGRARQLTKDIRSDVTVDVAVEKRIGRDGRRRRRPTKPNSANR